MSIVDTFDNQTEEIISPSHTSSGLSNFPKVAVVTFQSKVINVLKEKYQPEDLTFMNAGGAIPVYKIEYKHNDIAVYKTLPGGAFSVALMEEMHAKGCKKFVFFGSCGVLNKDIAEQALIVPTAAYRDEGTSYHYVPSADYISVKTSNHLINIMKELSLPFISGKTWTTDAFYRETRGNAEKRKNEGCITVEMECASIMAASQFRGFETYQFLYAADNLGGEQWDARTLGNLPQTSSEQHFRIALEIANKIY